MDDEIRIWVRWDINRTSRNRMEGLHWAEKRRLDRAATEAARIAWMIGGSPRIEVPVRVDIVIRRARKLDPDNALSGCRSLINGLFKDALTPDDSPEWLTIGEVRQETAGEHKHRESVEFIIRSKEGVDSRQ